MKTKNKNTGTIGTLFVYKIYYKYAINLTINVDFSVYYVAGLGLSL